MLRSSDHPKGFFPQQDTGALVGGLQGPQDASFSGDGRLDQTAGWGHKKRSRGRQCDCLHRRRRYHQFRLIYIALKPLAQRPPKSGAADIINRLRPKMNKLPVASAFLQAAQDLRIGGRGSNALYQYTIQCDNVQDLSKWGPILLTEMKKLPGHAGRQLGPAEQRTLGVRDL